MFRRQRISVFIIVLGVLIAIGTGLKAHFIHDVSDKDLSFTSGPSMSCNINGYTFTHTRETYSDGVIYTDSWWRSPQNPEVKITASTHGFGWASIMFYGNIDGQAKGDTANPQTPKKLGSFSALLPFAVGIDNDIETAFDGDFNRSPKTYSWDASGSIKLVPAYWQWSFPTGGEWLEASDIWQTNWTDSTGGSWTVQKNWTTLNRASPGSRPPSASNPPSGGSTPPTGSGSQPPDDGSGSTPPADPLSSDPGCSTDTTYDYCNDEGSCSASESSESGVASSRCGENYCCCYYWN